MAKTTTIKKWGNSLAVRLPAEVAAALALRDGSEVTVTTKDHSVVLKQTRKKS